MNNSEKDFDELEKRLRAEIKKEFENISRIQNKPKKNFRKKLIQLVALPGLISIVSIFTLVLFADETQKQYVFTDREVLTEHNLNHNFNLLFTRIGILENQNIPIGTILPWHKSMPNSPSLPGNWVECDGNSIEVEDSPYYGQNSPNLNSPLNGSYTRGTFLRGHTASGLFQTDSFKAHNHGYESEVRATGFGGTNETAEHVSEVRLNKNTQDAGGSETRPVNMTVVWILKVK